MKKFLSITLAAMLSLASLGITAYAAETEEDANLADDAKLSATEVLQVTETGSKIPNTYAKMVKGIDVNLGYFGGSVTNGYAPANDYNPAPSQGVNCWRGLSQTWLQEEYGTAYGMTFMETNSNRGVKYHAGLGGTGIDLNLYRADNALGLSTDDPVDLLFIEFSINDAYEGNTYEKSAFFMESTIRMIREKSPTTDIVVMLTTDHSKLANESNGGTTPHMNAQAHIDVAEYYDIPWFWFGDYMYDFLCSENGGAFPSSNSVLWQTYMADGCHPSPQGYKKYFEFLRDNFLIENLDSEKGYSTKIVEYTVPEVPYNATQEFLDNNKKYHPSSNSIYYNARLRTNATDIATPRNFGVAGYGYNPGGGVIVKDSTAKPGMSWSVKVKAQSAGMYYRGHPTMGMIQYRVDGGEWKYYNMYKSSTNQNEYFMFFENLPEEEHVVDVILRKTTNGDEWSFRSIFIEGDSTGFGAEILPGAPNTLPLNDLVQTPIVLTPSLLNTKITGNGYTNQGSSFDVYHLGIMDANVLRYFPNPASSDGVASDCYNTTLRSVSLPEYQYAVIKYYYELEPGTTEANAVGNRQTINFLQLSSGDPKNVSISSADTIILGGTSAHTSIIDLNAITARTGHTGNLSQMHFYPFGSGVIGTDLVESEIMNIESISFYADYPFDNQYEIEVAVDDTIGAAVKNISLSGKNILPSAHKYAIVKYTAEEDATLTLKFDNLYDLSAKTYTKTFTASKAFSASKNEVIIPLDEIASSGQTYYYENVALSATNDVEIESITFCVEYPDPDAVFTVHFDANGGEGTVPEAVSGKIGQFVNLPSASLEKGTQLFLGWGLTPDATTPVSDFTMPVDGTTLYAVYADAANLTYNANGGTGIVPPAVKALIGNSTTLVSANLTKDGAIFIGWGLTHDATTPVTSITMDEDGVTVYAIYKTLQTLYVTNDVSGKLTYNGTEVSADYATLGEALAALGANGGHIIFTGGFNYTDFFNNQNASAPMVILEGADSKAILRFESTSAVNAKLLCNTTLKNVKLLRGINEKNSVTDTYINGNSKEFILDVGTKTYDEVTKGQFDIGAEGALQGYTFKKFILNDGKISSNFHLTQYGNNSSGNVYYEINGGTPGVIQAGTLRFGEGTHVHTGNITVVINGGNLANPQQVLIDKSATVTTTVTGATSLIINNDLASSKSFTIDSKFKYVVKSSVGGTVSLAAEGASSYAPTFLIKANNPESTILINGEEVEATDGEYLFMPKSAGTFEVTYKGATRVYVNADGSGKLTVGGVEHKAYDTIAEAVANLDAEGGTIYFDGEQSYFAVEDASNLGFKKLTVRGVGEDSVLVFDTKTQTAGFGCDVAIENCHLREEANPDVWLRTGAHVVTFGNPNDTMVMKYLTKAGAETSAQCIVTGSGGKYVIYNCNFGSLGRDWSGTHNTNVVIEINGGKVTAGGISAFFGGGTLNASMAVSVNGVKLDGATINFENKGVINGNSILVFNDGAMHLQTYTISNVDYIVDAPTGIKVDIKTIGSSSAAPTFTLTPAEGVEKVFVNKSEITPVNGVYSYTPTSAGTLLVEADLVLPTITFYKGDATSGTAPGAVSGIADADVTIPACDLAKDGYRLAGWATTEGLVNPEYTTTIKMPEGGINLYPVWREAGVYYVTNEESGTVTYGEVTYKADYATIAEALATIGTAGGKVVFTGLFENTESINKVNASAPMTVLEGADDNAIIYITQQTMTFAGHTTFNNVKLLKASSAGDVYFKGNAKDVVFGKGTKLYAEATAGSKTIGAEAAIKGYDFMNLTVEDLTAADQLHLAGYQYLTRGNRHYTINGGNFTFIMGGALRFGSGTDTHENNITITVNGGTFASTTKLTIDKTATALTNVSGVASAIINNGIADTTAFTIDPKVKYVIKSAKGGTVTLAEEGSSTAAPKFLVKADDATMNILVNGEVVEAVNGEYTLTPAAGTTVVTYEKKPADVEFEITFGDKGETNGTIVDAETGFDGRAVLTIEGMAPIYLENAGNTDSEVSATPTLAVGTYSFKVTKPGYITYEGALTVNDDLTVDMDEIPTLIAGDIANSFEDTEGDGTIDLDDFIRVLRGFSDEGTKLLRQYVDLNEDGAVNVQDLAIIKANYGKTADDYAE